MLCMKISSRDASILRQVSRFGQLSAGHIRTLEFSANDSKTPCDRVLKRMNETKLLRRIERRIVGGFNGGSGVYVYQLGSKGWAYMRRETKFWAFRAIDEHTLAIADCYVQAVEAERVGLLRINSFTTEPDTWLDVAGAQLRPDLLLEVGVIAKRANMRLWVEVDQGTERRKQITDKIARYRHAYRNWSSEHGSETFPLVVFVAVDELRERELKTLLRGLPDEARKLFTVTTGETFPQLWIT